MARTKRFRTRGWVRDAPPVVRDVGVSATRLGALPRRDVGAGA